MNNRSGFTILELTMVLAISTIMMSGLFEMYQQVIRNMQRIERFVFEDMQIVTLKTRLEKDFLGLSVIWFAQQKLQDQQDAEQKNSAQASASDRAQEKLVSLYFYSINKHENLDFFTLVTVNPLQSYGAHQKHFARVVYQVQPDPIHKNMFRLMRKEIASVNEFVDEKSLAQGKFYQVIDGIKSIQTTYHFMDQKELQQREKQAEQQDKKSTDQQKLQPVVKTTRQWIPDHEEQKQDKNQQAAPQDKQGKIQGACIPLLVEMKLVFGATDQQTEQVHELKFGTQSTVSNLVKLPRDTAKQATPAAASQAAENKPNNPDSEKKGA